MAVLTIDGARKLFPADVAGRSQLLQDLLQHAEAPEDVQLPVDDEVIQLWLDYHQQRRGEPQTPGPGMAVDCMKRLLQAADVLIDDTTKAAMCSGLAASLEQSAEPPTPPACRSSSPATAAQLEPAPQAAPATTADCALLTSESDKVFSGLSQDLTEAILQLIPLPRCLTLLPPPLHALALATHAPSVHTDSKLALPPLPALLCPAAISAIAALPHLRDLSLAGHIVGPHAAALARVLRAVPALTALSLADCGFCASSTCGNTFATAISSLPNLSSLDLSHNVLWGGALTDLPASLPQLQTLTTLRVADAVSYAVPHDMHALAAAVAHLPALAVFSLGSLATQDQFSWGAAFTHALTALLRALCAAPGLTSLDFHFSHGMSIADTGDTAALWEGLGGLVRLRRLSLAIPVVKLSSAEKGVWEGALGRGLAALTCLTELDVRMHEVVHRVAQQSYAETVVAPLAALTALRRLRLPQFALAGGAEGRAALLCVLGLPSLTSLHVRGSRGVTYPQQASATAAAETALVGALCAAPRIRDVRMPVHMCAGEHSAAISALTAIRGRSEPPTALAVQLSFCSRGEQVHAQRDLLAGYVPLLRAACCLDLMAVDAQWLHTLTQHAAALSRVTSLRLTVLNPEAAAGPDHAAFICQLPMLTALRELSISLSSTVADADAQTVRHWPGLLTFCAQLPSLEALTALAVSVDAEGAALVATACAAHSGLASLDLVVPGPAAPLAPPLCRLPIGGLTMLRSLAVSAGHIAQAGDFWEQLPRLQQLRSLRLHGRLTSERVEALIDTVRGRLLALRELQVQIASRVQGTCLVLADLPCALLCTH